jgi:hypothetical protein
MDKDKAIRAIFDGIKNRNDGENIDFAIPGYAAKKLVTYQSILGDLTLCRDATIKLTKEKLDHTTTISLFHTIIILYGKCFTDAKSSKSSKLEIKDCFDEKDNELLRTHKNILDIRHNFVAHRGNTEHEVGVAFLRLNIKDLSRQVRVEQIKRRMPELTELPMYVKLFDHIIAVVEKKFQKEANKVWDHMITAYKPEYLAMLIIARPGSK